MIPVIIQRKKTIRSRFHILRKIVQAETVLIVNYKLDNMSLEEHAELGSAVAPSFVSENVPGLFTW